jgi:hypothetical protein
MDWHMALSEAWVQATTLLDELAALGRYPQDPPRKDRDADCLRVALALLRARRKGFEDGLASRAASAQAPCGHQPPPHEGETTESGREEP